MNYQKIFQKKIVYKDRETNIVITRGKVQEQIQIQGCSMFSEIKKITQITL